MKSQEGQMGGNELTYFSPIRIKKLIYPIRVDTASEGIKVSIRMRPLNEREISSGQFPIFRCLTDHNAVTQMKDNVPLEGQIFHFDKVFDENGTTDNVYSYAASDIVKGVANGINGTVFACKFN